MVIAKVSKRPFLEVPDSLFDEMDIKEGDQIQIVVLRPIKKEKKKLTKEEKLALLNETRGIWADDEKISEI